MTEDQLIRRYKRDGHTGEIALQLNSRCRRLRKIRRQKYLLSLWQFTGATAVLLGTKETNDRVKNSWRPPTLLLTESRQRQTTCQLEGCGPWLAVTVPLNICLLFPFMIFLFFFFFWSGLGLKNTILKANLTRLMSGFADSMFPDVTLVAYLCPVARCSAVKTPLQLFLFNVKMMPNSASEISATAASRLMSLALTVSPTLCFSTAARSVRRRPSRERLKMPVFTRSNKAQIGFGLVSVLGEFAVVVRARGVAG